MHAKVAALVVVLVAGMATMAPAQDSRSPCLAFQLDAYRQQYGSADECWAAEKGMRGATEACCNAAFGQPPFGCRRDIARLNIDWVFTDSGARLTYSRHRRGGATVLEAVLAAQGHNPNARREIEACGPFSEAYAKLKAPSADGLPWVPVGCEDAKVNADWVLFRDAGARRTYDALRKQNKSPYDSLWGAQAHNRSAQGHLALCRSWIGSYAELNE